jgi:hypothetical protein
MRIDSSGNLLVGQTSASTVVDGAFIRTGNSSGFISTNNTALDLNRQGNTGTIILFRSSNSSVGSVSVTGSSTTYNTSSDVRLKENITEADSFDITALKVRQFDWKVDGSHQPYGFIAQELHEVFPDAVSVGGEDEKTEPWAVDNSKLVPMLVKEIQDLRARVAQLEEA